MAKARFLLRSSVLPERSRCSKLPMPPQSGSTATANQHQYQPKLVLVWAGKLPRLAVGTTRRRGSAIRLGSKLVGLCKRRSEVRNRESCRRVVFRQLSHLTPQGAARLRPLARYCLPTRRPERVGANLEHNGPRSPNTVATQCPWPILKKPAEARLPT